MTTKRHKFSSQVSPELPDGIRGIARREGRHFQAVLEETMAGYIESKSREKVRPEFMAHFRASLERNRRLSELLADS